MYIELVRKSRSYEKSGGVSPRKRACTNAPSGKLEKKEERHKILHH